MIYELSETDAMYQLIDTFCARICSYMYKTGSYPMTCLFAKVQLGVFSYMGI